MIDSPENRGFAFKTNSSSSGGKEGPGSGEPPGPGPDLSGLATIVVIAFIVAAMIFLPGMPVVKFFVGLFFGNIAAFLLSGGQ